jgi:hypothetical protein
MTVVTKWELKRLTIRILCVALCTIDICSGRASSPANDARSMQIMVAVKVKEIEMPRALRIIGFSPGREFLAITSIGSNSVDIWRLSDVPQLVSPWHVESFMAVRRLEANGFGMSLSAAGSGEVIQQISRACKSVGNDALRDFAARVSKCDDASRTLVGIVTS